MNPPFNANGVYVNKIDPNKEIENFKSTKLSRIWNITVGGKDENFYRLLYFHPDYDYNSESNSLKVIRYGATLSTMTGELLEIVDQQKGRGYNYADYKSVDYDEKVFSFEKKNISFRGKIDNEKAFLLIKNSETGETTYLNFRFIPWT